MKRFLSFSALVCLAAMLLAARPAFADVVGKVTSVTQGAIVVRGRTKTALANKASLEAGDVIRTDASGEVQIVFIDRTRIVVGPASELEVEEFSRSNSGTASRFAVKAVGGTFRFLSGRSPKPAYELKTPTATMGIRGTEFDFSVTDRRLTNLVTYEGQVRICTRSRSCARVSGGCTVVSANRSRIIQPETEDDKKILLATNFPYAVSQEGLGRDYRVRVEPCGDLGDVQVSVAKSKSIARTGASTFEGGGGGESDGPGGQSDGPGGGYSESADEN